MYDCELVLPACHSKKAKVQSWAQIPSLIVPQPLGAYAITMDMVQKLAKRIPSPHAPALDDFGRRKERILPRLDFFRRRIRLKGNSNVSVPLAVLLLFPILVIILIFVLVVLHPSSPGLVLMPAGAPPSIR